MRTTPFTPDELAQIATTRDEWMRVGLSTDPIDRVEAEAAIRTVYRTAGIDEPRIWIWMTSPLGVVTAGSLFSGGQLVGQLMGQLRDQLMGQLRDQLEDQLGDQLEDQLGDQLRLRGQLVGQLVGQLGGQLVDQLRIRDQLVDQLWGQLGGQLRDQLGGQLRDQLVGQLRIRDQLVDQLWGQLGGQLRDQLGDQLVDQLVDQLRGQLMDQLRDQLVGQLRDQLRGQLMGQLGGQLAGQLVDQLGDQLAGQLVDQLGDQLRDQLGDQLAGQLVDQLVGQLRLRDQLVGQLVGQLRDQLRGQARTLIWKQVWGAWESYWLAFYDLGLAFSGDTPLRPRLNAMTAAAHTCGAWLPMRGAVIVGDRPDNIRRDNTGRLHSNNGPALTYADGYTLHAWHGTRVPAWVIDAPTIEQIAVERNTEIRRCAIESLGWPTYLDRLGVSPVSVEPDPGNPGHDLALYDVPDALSLFGGDVRLLVMSNASRDRDGSRRIFAETVPASCASAVDAAAWQFGADPTTYRALERAT